VIPIFIQKYQVGPLVLWS